ncbi:MAG: STAS domain-containing protein [Phycisphaerales bacterium]
MWNPFASREERTAIRTANTAMRAVEAGERAQRVHQMADVERLGQAAIVTLTITELIGLEAAQQLTEMLEEVTASGAENLVLDVQNIQIMDSASLSELIKTAQALRRRGGRIALVNADRSVQYLFKLTKLDRMFPVCNDVMAALKTMERPVASVR